MIFNSFTYLLFLALICVVYWSLGRTARLFTILGASIVFYGFWNFYFVPLLFISVFVDYFAGIYIHGAQSAARRKALLALSIAVNFSLLAFFKYYYFVMDNTVAAARLLGVEWNPTLMTVLLPIGISFYTFQSVSYTIDVYRRQIEPTRDFALFASYVTFFPQLVAGPILRAGEVIWQLERRPKFDVGMVTYGMSRILGGLALKVLLADNIAVHVNQGFAADPSQLSVIDVSTLTFLFGFQIYFDFAAYSHIALGSALIMGIMFPENFNFPYHARSPRDFWRRWHISLSSWIRDYLYMPLMGLQGGHSSTGGIAQRVDLSTTRTTLALFATWAIMGLWHGSDWTFVFWGLWHATIIFGHRFIAKALETFAVPTLVSAMGAVLSFYLIMLGWVPFRAESMADTLAMFAAFFDPSRWMFLGLRENTYLIAALMLFVTAVGPAFWNAIMHLRNKPSPLGYFVLWGTSTLAVAGTLVYLRPLDQFIYFQF